MKKRKKRKAPKSLVNTKVEHTGLFRRKTVSAQLMKDGVWNKGADRQLADAMAEFPDSIYDIIDENERDIEEVLARHPPPYGQKIESSGADTTSALPQLVIDALMTRATIQLLRKALDEDNSAEAAWQTWRLVGSTITNALRPAEPLVLRGRAANERARRGGQKAVDSAQASHKEWQRAADRIWKSNPTLSAREVAKRVKTSVGSERSPHTIRRRIANTRR